MPIYIWDLNGPGNFYGFPSEPNQPGQVKVAFHMRGDTPLNSIAHPCEVNREVADEEVQAIRQVLARKFPAMNNKLLRTETCMYTSTQDNHL